jgi:cation diffusion facilitator family transporter
MSMETPEAQHEKRRVAMSSILAAVAITGLKLVVGLQTNSLGILSEAAHSGLDLIAATMTYVAVRISGRPPDRDHQYGHGKIENLSAFLETLLLVITCAWIIWEAIQRLVTRSAHVDASIWGYAVVTFAIVVDYSRSRALKRVARKYNSQALEADALHFSSDIWSSLVVLAGLFFVSTGYVWMDALAALAVAVLVLIVSYRLARRTVDALMDRVPEGLYDDILSTVQGVEGVEEVRSIRLRPLGAKVFVDATVAIRRTTPFQRAHSIMDSIEQRVRSRHADADIVVHAEPFESDDESIADKVRMIVLERGLGSPHNLEVHHSGGKFYIDFDLEYRKGSTFVEAHDSASSIEEEIRRKVPAAGKITIHMEEYDPGHTEIMEKAGTRERLQKEIRECILADKRVLRCSDISLLTAGKQYVLSLNCGFDKANNLGEVHHIICELENQLYEKFKVLRRVTVHAEPY